MGWLTFRICLRDGRVRLPPTLDPEQISAQYLHGRLTVSVAKTAEAEPRRIAINATAQPELVPVESSDEGQGTSVAG